MLLLLRRLWLLLGFPDDDVGRAAPALLCRRVEDSLDNLHCSPQPSGGVPVVGGRAHWGSMALAREKDYILRLTTFGPLVSRAIRTYEGGYVR